jgi:hypothetical protein
VIALLAGTLALAAGGAASPPGETAAAFAAAGRAYEAGRLPEARAAYEKLAAAGEAGAAVCYNLGNTWWRLNRRGQAVLWWERARRLAPRDDDVRFNLALARAASQDEEIALGDTLDRIATPAELWWLVTALAWAVGLGAGVALWRGAEAARWRRVATVGAPLLALFAGWLIWRVRDLQAGWAVADVPTAEVRSGPGDQFPVGFTIPDGRRTLILNRRPGWVEVGVPSQSLKGWVPDTAVAPL